MIKAVIFDMDGVLIDSEPLWRKAEGEVFRSIGLPFSDGMGKESTGMRYDHMVDYWYTKFKITHPPKEETGRRVVDKTIELILKEGKLKSGVREIISFFISKNLKIALASSSPMEMIQTIIRKLGIHHHFEIVHSGENEEFPKPHPDIFLTVADRLRVKPAECLAIEDSPRGVASAKNAGMKCLAVPEKHHRNDVSIKKADIVLDSLSQFDGEVWQRIA